jgi:hypothetical protein
MSAYVWLLVATVVLGAAADSVGGSLLALVAVVLLAARGAFRADRPAGYAGMLSRYVR